MLHPSLVVFLVEFWHLQLLDLQMAVGRNSTLGPCPCSIFDHVFIRSPESKGYFWGLKNIKMVETFPGIQNLHFAKNWSKTTNTAAYIGFSTPTRWSTQRANDGYKGLSDGQFTAAPTHPVLHLLLRLVSVSSDLARCWTRILFQRCTLKRKKLEGVYLIFGNFGTPPHN